jgi:hypothetical protein
MSGMGIFIELWKICCMGSNMTNHASYSTGDCFPEKKKHAFQLQSEGKG